MADASARPGQDVKIFDKIRQRRISSSMKSAVKEEAASLCFLMRETLRSRLNTKKKTPKVTEPEIEIEEPFPEGAVAVTV